jgi:hypothetical protein
MAPKDGVVGRRDGCWASPLLRLDDDNTLNLQHHAPDVIPLGIKG